MFAGVTDAVPKVVMALAVAIYYFVGPKTIFRPVTNANWINKRFDLADGCEPPRQGEMTDIWQGSVHANAQNQQRHNMPPAESLKKAFLGRRVQGECADVV